MMDFRILGSLEVLDEGREVTLGGAKQRALLAVLVLRANETVSTDRLIEELWEGRPPATAAKTVQVHVSRLRKALAAGGDLIETREHGYRLALDPDRLDAHRFERLVGQAREQLAAGQPERTLAVLEDGLALWRGEPLADLAYEAFARQEIARLEELRVAALELLIEAKLALGGHTEVIGQLEVLIAEYPFREGLRAQLMLALYRAERQADALQAYQNTRRKLVEELGIEPGERLRELERAILAQDPALALPVREARPVVGAAPAGEAVAGEAGAAAPEAGAEGAASRAGAGARRLVSIVFADLVGSTGLGERLDPESMHALLDRYTEVCGAVIERHGGSVEGFIGDAVVGVFGLTELHEDDALRAVRAAVELREAGAALSAELERERGVGIGMKFGVESGEVFLRAGARRSPFAAGDAFNVASRLEGQAPEGEILLGENTYPLVRDRVRAEPLEPLELKGRAAKVQAWRLLELDPGASRPASPTPFVNRFRELAQLRDAFARARDERVCTALTVIGPAGIGKSRLVHELVADLHDEATVAVGHCLSYGEDVTYRPLAEVVSQLGGADPQRRVEELLTGDGAVARLVLGAIGLADSPAQAEETSWAVRRLLERVAAERPLVLVVEDVHWADPTMLDLLEYLIAFSSGHSILLACIARPEFVEARPVWVAPGPHRSLIALSPLSSSDARELVDSTGELGADTAARIVETAEGNPLFLEQLVAVGADDGGTALPSSIQAVLTARIDRLDPSERAVLELASVQGRSFHVDVLTDLLDEPARPLIPGRLVSLVQQQLIRPHRSDVPGQDAFRFAHALIREAAYHGLPKQRRAELHERVARWPSAQDETIGFHLGEACRLLAELGVEGERERAMATTAADRLEAAAQSALLRGDPPAGARLLERAESLRPHDDPARVALLPRLGAALLEAGRLADADRVLTQAIERAGDDPLPRSRALVERQLVYLQSGASTPPAESERIADDALAVFERHGDRLGQSRALDLRARQALIEGRLAVADDAWRRAAEFARDLGDEAALFEILDWRGAAALFGPTPVPDAIALCRQIHEQLSGNPVAAARILRPLAALEAMAGHEAEARRLLEAGDEILGEVGGLAAAITQQEALVELLAGNLEAAAERLRRGCDSLAAMGEKALLATTAAMQAQALYALGRYDDAGTAASQSEACAAEEDVSAQVGWRSVRAKLLARARRAEEAERLAVEAARLADRTDLLTLRAEAQRDLAEVLAASGRSGEAGQALRNAVTLYRKKGDVASAHALGR